MKYEELPPLGRDTIVADLRSGDADRVCSALVRVAQDDSDRAFAEDVLEEFLASEDPWIRGLAATCVGHVARIHRALDGARLIPMVRRLANDPATAGRAKDALSDIRIFTSLRP